MFRRVNTDGREVIRGRWSYIYINLQEWERTRWDDRIGMRKGTAAFTPSQTACWAAQQGSCQLCQQGVFLHKRLWLWKHYYKPLTQGKSQLLSTITRSHKIFPFPSLSILPTSSPTLVLLEGQVLMFFPKRTLTSQCARRTQEVVKKKKIKPSFHFIFNKYAMVLEWNPSGLLKVHHTHGSAQEPTHTPPSK